MTRLASAAALAAIGAALLGCPLPQPLPDYPPGAITPPRILSDGIRVDGVPANSQAVLLVPAGCATAPVYQLGALIHDTNTIEQVEARWFVNYHPSAALPYYTAWQVDTVPPDPDPLVLTRFVPPRDPASGAERPFAFAPYDYPAPAGSGGGSGVPNAAAGVLRVVELVVSNGFDPAANAPPAPLPRRTPLAGFETQVYRWVFLTVPESTGCTRGEPGCVLCPG